MLKQLLAGAFLLSSLAITGCTTANFTKVESFPDLTKTEDFIIKGESDTKAVREIFGTPTMILKTKNDGHSIYAYAITSENDYGAEFSDQLENIFKKLGFTDLLENGTTYTQKNVYFKFSQDNKVEDIQFNGYAWLIPGIPLDFKSYLFQKLNDQEIKSTKPMLVNDVVDSFSNKNISAESIEQYELDRVMKGIVKISLLCFHSSAKLFDGDVLFVEENLPSESYDGIESSVLFDKVEYTYK